MFYVFLFQKYNTLLRYLIFVCFEDTTIVIICNLKRTDMWTRIRILQYIENKRSKKNGLL